MTWNAERRCFISAEAAERWNFRNISLCTSCRNFLCSPVCARGACSRSLRYSLVRSSALSQYLHSNPNKTKLSSLFHLCLTVALYFSFSSLQNKIAQNRFWPVEIMRTPVQQATKAKGKQASSEEDIPISFHGVAYVNMAPLLYPGVKRFVTVIIWKSKAFVSFAKSFCKFKPATLC